jgi:hypothetical protein
MCEGSRLAREYVSQAAAEGSGLSLSAQWIAEFDKVAQFHREEAARRAGGVGSAGTDTTAMPQSGDGPPVSPSPAKKLRVPSKKELKRRKAEREGRALTPSWLLEEDPMVQAILETPHDDS